MHVRRTVGADSIVAASCAVAAQSGGRSDAERAGNDRRAFALEAGHGQPGPSRLHVHALSTDACELRRDSPRQRTRFHCELERRDAGAGGPLCGYPSGARGGGLALRRHTADAHTWRAVCRRMPGESGQRDCLSCGICQERGRSVIVGFPAHGARAKRVERVFLERASS